MGRKSAGPRYWPSKEGWYCTHRRKRYHLATGGRDEATEAVAWRKYREVTGDTAAHRPVERDDLIRLGRILELCHHISWGRLRRDIEADQPRRGTEGYLDLITFRSSVGRPWNPGECATAGEAQQVLVEVVGVIPNSDPGVPSNARVIPPLRGLMALYPVWPTAAPSRPPPVPNEPVRPRLPPQPATVEEVDEPEDGEATDGGDGGEYRHRRPRPDVRGRRVKRKKLPY